MARILLLGYDPPIFYPEEKTEAANYRTWQFLEPLLEDEHSVFLCTYNEVLNHSKLSVPKEWIPKLKYQPIRFGRSGWRSQLQQIHDNFKPDSIVAANFYPSLYATRLKTNMPIWMDIYGDVITIIQAANFHHKTNRGLPTTIQFVREVLLRGDIFSVCGIPQKHMLVGELAMTGRLNHLTFGYEFVRTILPGAAPLDIDPSEGKSRNLLSNLDVSNEDFVVLWAGGYNTWTDTQTLFKGLEWAMEQNPSIHFVSVGANTYQAKDNTYAQFLEYIQNSKHRKHYHMLGWRPWVEIPQYYAESDIGINIDALHYETIYGTRTRLLEMISVGLPVITSLGSELSYTLREQQLAITFEIQDWKSLGRQILSLSRNPEKRDNMSKMSLQYAKKDLSFESTTIPLRDWVQTPQVAPDRENESSGSIKIKNLEYQGRAFFRQILWKLTGSDK